jgi:hypothetical protein
VSLSIKALLEEPRTEPQPEGGSEPEVVFDTEAEDEVKAAAAENFE